MVWGTTSSEYRAGLRLTISGVHYYFSRSAFMQRYEQFIDRLLRNDDRPKLDKHHGSHRLASVDDFFRASTSFDETVDDRVLWLFDVADRKIQGGFSENRYLRDPNLSHDFQGQFKHNGATYPDMVKFLHSHQVDLSDSEIAQQMLEILIGAREETQDCPLMALIIAVLFIAEPSRNPSVFLPSLMFLDLARQSHLDSFGDPYTMINGLCNPILPSSKREKRRPTTHLQSIYARMVGMPTLQDLTQNRSSSSKKQISE